MANKRDIIVRESHRGLWYEDGVFKKELPPGKYEAPVARKAGLWAPAVPQIDVVLVDIRERELTIKGQEILTADKVAIRVSIVVKFQVTDAAAAVHKVQNFEERIYSDVQLAARRSLAAMTLEEILTNRNRLSEDILRDVKESASRLGIAVQGADVKDLVFPGNLQEIMNRVLAAERLSQAQLVEARTKAEMQRIEAETRAHSQQKEAEVTANAIRLKAQAEAEALQIRSKSEAEDLAARQSAGKLLKDNPALLRLRELEMLAEMSKVANARIYIGMEPQAKVTPGKD